MAFRPNTGSIQVARGKEWGFLYSSRISEARAQLNVEQQFLVRTRPRATRPSRGALAKQHVQPSLRVLRRTSNRNAQRVKRAQLRMMSHKVVPQTSVAACVQSIAKCGRALQKQRSSMPARAAFNATQCAPKTGIAATTWPVPASAGIKVLRTDNFWLVRRLADKIRFGSFGWFRALSNLPLFHHFPVLRKRPLNLVLWSARADSANEQELAVNAKSLIASHR